MSRERHHFKRAFTVKLMRPVFEVAIVAVHARNEKEARSIALTRASGLEEASWTGRFDSDRYTYDVQEVDDTNAAVTEPDLRKREAINRRLGRSVRYLLLRGELDDGEGRVLVQPWLTGQSSLMVADLCQDWCLEIHAIEEGKG